MTCIRCRPRRPCPACRAFSETEGDGWRVESVRVVVPDAAAELIRERMRAAGRPLADLVSFLVWRGLQVETGVTLPRPPSRFVAPGPRLAVVPRSSGEGPSGDDRDEGEGRGPG